jgi:hypothetical protein
LIEALRRTVERAYAAHALSAPRFERRSSGRPAYGLVGQPGPADAGRADAPEPLLTAFTALARALGLEAGRVQESGERLDLHLRDRLDRAWPVGWIERAAGGWRASLLGPLTDVLALLLEHGPLPLWLAPEQARVLPIGAGQQTAAEALLRRLREAGLRAELDAAGPLAGRVRRATGARVPAVLVIGAREAAAGTVARRGGHDETTGACLRRLLGEAEAPFSDSWVVSGAAPTNQTTR